MITSNGAKTKGDDVEVWWHQERLRGRNFPHFYEHGVVATCMNSQGTVFVKREGKLVGKLERGSRSENGFRETHLIDGPSDLNNQLIQDDKTLVRKQNDGDLIFYSQPVFVFYYYGERVIEGRQEVQETDIDSIPDVAAKILGEYLNETIIEIDKYLEV